MKSKVKSDSAPIRLKLNAPSAVFFHQLAMKGHAKYHQDDSVPEDELHVVANNSTKGVKFAILHQSQIGHL